MTLTFLFVMKAFQNMFQIFFLTGNLSPGLQIRSDPIIFLKRIRIRNPAYVTNKNGSQSIRRVGLKKSGQTYPCRKVRGIMVSRKQIKKLGPLKKPTSQIKVVSHLIKPGQQ